MAESPKVDFSRDVLPVLSDRCFLCHGPDAEAREAGLRLDGFELATAELDSGLRAIVPGDVDASELVKRIISDDDSELMPPADSGKTLSAAERELLTRWIAEGAKYKQHWAFESVARPEVPKVKNEAWAQNAIDRFVLARLEAEGLAPTRKAEPGKLARRIHLDLVGIPPSLSQLHEFASDESPEAVGRLVDQLFASPHYGERMAIDWLDGARYADSNGYQNDFARHMWPWRDWVIKAFNANMPYDQFTIEQLAGDLLPNPTRSQRVATGFNRNNRTVTEAGSIDEEWLVENVVDRVETTSSVFLGLTMGCARCHDHKYDPISQREFYEFYAFFNNIAEQGVVTETRGNVAPKITVPSVEQEAELAERAKQIASLRKMRSTLKSHTTSEEMLDQLEELAGGDPLEAKVHLTLTADGGGMDTPAGGMMQTGGSSREPVQFGVGLPGSVARFVHGGLVCGNLWAPNRESGFTCSLWVKPVSDGALVSRMDGGEGRRGFDISLIDGERLSVHLIHAWPESSLKVTSKTPLPKGQWSQCTVTYDGSSRASGVRCYVNGRPVELDTHNDTLNATIESTQPLRLGQRSDELYFAGELAEVEFFDRPLSIVEVQRQLAQHLLALHLQTAAVVDDDAAKEVGALSSELIAARKRAIRDEVKQLETELKEFEEKLPSVMVMEEREERRPTFVLKRGLYDQPDKDQPVDADVPSFLPPLAEGKHDRLALANWLVSRENPLTARVMVNRLWTKFFGRGLVASPENFGVQSEVPSHPELLDWLAVELIESGWDLQHLQRLIVTSATYQQSSARSAELQERDANNLLLARGPRVRLTAELIRDNALTVSGLLTPTMGGPSVMPYQPEGLWAELAGGAHETYTQDHGEALYRRSLYIYRKRTVPHPSLSTFDAPSWEICQIKRAPTNTPQQALALLNDVTYVEAARKLAAMMLEDGNASVESRLAIAFESLTAREPRGEELKKLVAVLEKYQHHFAADPYAAKEFIQHGESARGAEGVDDVTLAAYAATASLILNLDEAVTKD
ncbi:DUF1553 domain-containing protein [Aeoliella sp. SH292]|uniref:DUF1553 domain-containing protein n=1 Tax=Aeoliella sp. SH292 TaxID=3454464 RepID=UPI003F99C9E0